MTNAWSLGIVDPVLALDFVNDMADGGRQFKLHINYIGSGEGREQVLYGFISTPREDKLILADCLGALLEHFQRRK